MNDALLPVDAREGPPLDAAHVAALSLGAVLELGAELFAEEPLLPHARPERARRLCALIRAKNPAVNAALFVAPARDCAPAEVQTRLAEVSTEVMAALYARWSSGGLNPVSADREVWRRLAA